MQASKIVKGPDTKMNGACTPVVVFIDENAPVLSHKNELAHVAFFNKSFDLRQLDINCCTDVSMHNGAQETSTDANAEEVSLINTARIGKKPLSAVPADADVFKSEP
jgi:hypothetical protein